MTKQITLVMGICGVGKSTIAEGIARATGARFVEADQYHPPENIAAMSAGIPLTDDMRWGWLDQVGEAVRRAAADGPVVLACSALKRAYRDRLRAKTGPFRIVYLHGARSLIESRMSARKAHFMPTALIDSQCADLQPPDPNTEDALWLDIETEPDALVARAVNLPGELRDAPDHTQLRRTS